MMATLKKHSTASSLMVLSHIACKPSLSGSTATTPSTRITSVCSHGVDDHLLMRPSPQSISLSPIPTDGRIQVQDPCAAETNVITYYDQPTLFSGWSIIADPNHARYMLQLLRFDGALEPRMYLYYKPPMMLPSESSSPTSIARNLTRAFRSLAIMDGRSIQSVSKPTRRIWRTIANIKQRLRDGLRDAARRARHVRVAAVIVCGRSAASLLLASQKRYGQSFLSL